MSEYANPWQIKLDPITTASAMRILWFMLHSDTTQTFRHSPKTCAAVAKAWTLVELEGLLDVSVQDCEGIHGRTLVSLLGNTVSGSALGWDEP